MRIFFMKQFIRKADIILLFVLVLFSLAGSAFLSLHGNAVVNSSGSNSESKAVVIIKSGGKLISEQPLSEDATLEISAANDRSRKSEKYNIVSIKDGKVYVSEASCKNQVCVRHGVISRPGESIVCLPNRLVVSIEQGSEEVGGGYDSITS